MINDNNRLNIRKTNYKKYKTTKILEKVDKNDKRIIKDMNNPHNRNNLLPF